MLRIVPRAVHEEDGGIYGVAMSHSDDLDEYAYTLDGMLLGECNDFAGVRKISSPLFAPFPVLQHRFLPVYILFTTQLTHLLYKQRYSEILTQMQRY